MAPDGAWGYQVGQLTRDDATEKAQRVCEKHGVAGCRIILLNDDPAQ